MIAADMNPFIIRSKACSIEYTIVYWKWSVKVGGGLLIVNIARERELATQVTDY